MFKLLFSTDKRKAEAGVYYLARVIGEISDYWVVVTKNSDETTLGDFIEFSLSHNAYDKTFDYIEIVELYRLPKF